MVSQLIDNSLHALEAGQTLLYPTDTIWGIGCDATNPKAVERIYAIKQRDHAKSMLILVTEAMISPNLPLEAHKLLLHSQSPTTVIIPQKMVLCPIAQNLPAKNGTIGVRIPKNDFCQALLQRLCRPIVSTSANLSGHPSPATYTDIEDDIKSRVDLALPDHPTFHHSQQSSSRIVQLLPDGQIVTLR